MVTTKKIKGLEFSSIGDYFQYIIDSIINGQNKQSKDLFKDLSKSQKLDFYEFIGEGKERGLNLVEVFNVVNN